MEIAEVRKQIKEKAEWSLDKIAPVGGQQCGLPVYKGTLYSEELNVKISIGYYRSQIRNRELATTIFDIIVDEIIK